MFAAANWFFLISVKKSEKIRFDSATTSGERPETIGGESAETEKLLKWPFDMGKVNIEPEDFDDFKKKSEPLVFIYRL